MNIYRKNSNIRILITTAICLLFFIGCGTTMNIVEKSLDEGDFVPVEALDTVDFLNQYPHHLPPPSHTPLDINIAFERDNVLVTGDELYAQIALVTTPPIRKAKNVHIIAFNSSDTSNAELREMDKAVQSIIKQVDQLPPGSSVTVDWNAFHKELSKLNPLLKKNSDSDDLVAYLRQFTQLPLRDKEHHFILLLGDHWNLSHKQKQDSVDIANLMEIKSRTLSVLSVGDKPQTAFLRKLSTNGSGRFNVTGEHFNFKKWIADEIQFISAARLSDIRISVSTKDPISIRNIVSPTGLAFNKDQFHHTLQQLTQGDQYVMMLELGVANLSQASLNDMINVEVEYYDSHAKRYSKLSKQAQINYVSDRNLILNNDNQNVTRSLLILDTKKVLQDIVPIIENKRYYQAIAMLTQHSLKLEQFAQDSNDQQLLKDARLLNRYSDKLYDFDETIFQTLKIWDDLYFDTNRYSESFD